MRALGQQAFKAHGRARIHYERHRPEECTLYRLVQQHAATFFAQVEAATGTGLPKFVKDEFDAFLECGILAHGFLRLRCADCAHDKLVAFSCKRRGFCPSCGARRMSETAAHLVDHVIPEVPVRQWVLSLPLPLRLLLAAQPELITPVLQVVQRALSRYLLRQAGIKAGEGDCGSVTLIQRFGSAANLNIHLHCLVLDGVYRTNAKGAPEFVEAPPPSDEQVWEVLQSIIKRVMKQLVRRGILVEDQGETYLVDPDDDSDQARALRPLHRGSCVYRIAFGPRAGQKVLTVQGALPREASGNQKLCANSQGFSLHAAVRCGAGQRKTLERLCRYITRPALANDRVQINAAGQVELKLKTPWRDGTTHQVMSPLELMQRLAALVPRPRLHLIRFHGVLAPNAKLRAKVVPQAPAEPAQKKPSPEDGEAALDRPMRLGWAKLLKRVFNLDLEHCPNCGGELKIIAAILERPAKEKILNHLGLQARAPPRAPALGQMPLQDF